ncbi:outer membrane lipoprotein chaperone LolA [[Haemophilus] ducreyi]|uniref:outer membrane lipoprotein chaperone LolA n=1 Tax=Haemophilus ducreyi TaxID=730 RepID=UPI000655EE6A|nr:outer membrane lipoprotein chaperone LolA [[Haemophilus] ducreyi]AKO45494.1 lipoprotein chaperone [[Haemophilus] ducreyi]AKO46881.1 lipoprotein chaperone [[Haemophilus] ducreyi]AKO48221.1 lipoprotein chaperone [[Haemophilus] ducreyi]AKO49612.1 lipoprotein chaperone [[Haemophilus] ducreyi]ANF62524.1 outer-membrane lipoprotein carrier protein LolA [[Haemophilus] ducreyi]
MKKRIQKTILTVLFSSLSLIAFADMQSVAELQRRLEHVAQYSADFEQTVRSSKGQQIQSGRGKFQVKRPNLFRMDINAPQENVIVSDGENLWFYDPFVAQVTVNSVQNAVNGTPFVLLTSSDKQHWTQYEVTQNADRFVLKPKSAKNNLRQFDVQIDQNGLLKGFSTIERDGQTNLYRLRNITTAELSADLFKFSVPKDVEVDDQRRVKK